MTMEDGIGGRAVVLGGSMAGMLAARVLAEHYAEVVVVDRDDLLGAVGPRRAVPQASHIHALLARGQRILEDLFPGLTNELVARGASIGDFGSDLRWYFGGARLKPDPTGLICVGAGRPLLESQVRKRVRELAGITFLEQTDIAGLVPNAAGDRIVGVRVSGRIADSAEQTLTADLVIDATGRGSRTGRWLQELGYPTVPEEVVKMGLTYTSADFAIPRSEDLLGSDIASIPVASPDNPRGAIFARMPGVASVSLTGILGQKPPTDIEGFREYARSLPVPEVYEAIRDVEPVNGPFSFSFPASRRRRFERMSRFPDGLLVIGDAACIFNPVYGQGMSMAAVEATILRDLLRRGAAGPRAYFKAVAKAQNAPWSVSAGGDLSFPEVEGKRTFAVRMANAYVPKLQAAAASDGVLAGAFLRVAGLIDGPQRLLTPAMMLRVLRAPKPKAQAGAGTVVTTVSAPPPIDTIQASGVGETEAA